MTPYEEAEAAAEKMLTVYAWENPEVMRQAFIYGFMYRHNLEQLKREVRADD